MILGIECTAHTFGIALVDNGKILCNLRDMYTTEAGGIIPMESAKHHDESAPRLYADALKEVGVDEEKIDGIALSNAPGLAPCLLSGLRFAKELANRLNVPIIPVNHCIAHLEIGKSTGAKDPVLLYASGANTQIIAYASGKYRVFGETLDLGVGNFIDTVGRFMGMGFPGGPKLQKLAEEFKGQIKVKENKDGEYELLELPYSIKGMDVSFTGLQTKIRQLLDKGENSKEELAYAMQEHVFAMLVEAAERALAHTGKKELVLGGGVACNSRLQEMAKIMCEERGCNYFCPERPLLVDNAAMIAYTGEVMNNKDKTLAVIPNTKEFEDLDINPRQRTDQVEVSWK
jgi:glycoprotease/Kae1 family metallohydrolase